MSFSRAWRLTYLDALRGFAILQVVLSNYLGAFYPATLPDLSADQNSIVALLLAVLTDAYSGICLFFLISGYTMTFTYGESVLSIARLLAARAIRLAVPTLTAIGLGMLALQLLPAEAWTGYRWSGSVLIDGLHPTSISTASLVANIIASVVGYNGTSVAADLVTASTGIALPLAASFDPSLWCGCLQFAGSLFVITLIGARRLRLVVWIALLMLASLATIATPISAMLFGHALARSPFVRSPRLPAAFGVIAIGLGLHLCLFPRPEIAIAETDLARHLSFLPFAILPAVAEVSKIAGTTLLFTGVVLSARLQQALAGSGLARIGCVSLPLYLSQVPVMLGVTAISIRLFDGVRGEAMDFVALASLAATAAVTAAFAGIDRYGRVIARWIASDGLDDRVDIRLTSVVHDMSAPAAPIRPRRFG